MTKCLKAKVLQAVVLLSAITLCIGFLVGCGGESKPKQEEKPLEVMSGYFQDDTGYMELGVLIKNPNEDLQFDAAALSVTVKDADGKVIASDDE